MAKNKIILLVMVLFICNAAFGGIKTDSKYIVMEIADNQEPWNIRFVQSYTLASHGEYYLASEKDILNFIQKKQVDKSKLIILLDRNSAFYPADAGKQYCRYLFDFSELRHLIWLNDTGVYSIGSKQYVIRKLEYAYMDDLHLVAPQNKIDLLMTDNVESSNDTTLVGADAFYKQSYFQYYFYTIRLLPNHKDLKKYLWKQRYQLLEDNQIN